MGIVNILFEWLGPKSLAHRHLLLVSNDTVPISTWRGGGMRATELLCRKCWGKVQDECAP